jgi:hypothetical protein
MLYRIASTILIKLAYTLYRSPLPGNKTQSPLSNPGSENTTLILPVRLQTCFISGFFHRLLVAASAFAVNISNLLGKKSSFASLAALFSFNILSFHLTKP